MKAQGSQLFFIDPEANSFGCAAIEVGCVLNLDGIDTTTEQNEVTCLADLTRRYEAGLATPGAASFDINFNMTDASHLRLHQLKVAGTSLKWALGWSDGLGIAPEVDTACDFDPPDTRSWILFEGFMTSFPFNFAQNAQVVSKVGIQVSGEPILVPKAPAP